MGVVGASTKRYMNSQHKIIYSAHSGAANEGGIRWQRSGSSVAMTTKSSERHADNGKLLFCTDHCYFQNRTLPRVKTWR